MLNPAFVKLVVDKLPEAVREILINHGPGLMVAGGFVRDILSNKDPKDIDLFATSSYIAHNAVKDFTLRLDYTETQTSNATTFWSEVGGLPVQFITRDFQPDRMNTLLDFDFTINQAGVYHGNGQWFGIASEAFLEDLPAREMTYNTASVRSDVFSSVLRAFKFAEAGWKISGIDIENLLGKFTKTLDAREPLVSTSSQDQHTLRVRRAFSSIREYAGVK